jgi:hypothetical protein
MDKEKAMIQDLIAVLNLAVFTALIYVVKEVLDSKRLIQRHPYIKSPWLRVSLIVIVVSQLILTIKPEWYHIANMTFNIGTLSALGVLAYIYHRNTIRIMKIITKRDDTSRHKHTASR